MNQIGVSENLGRGLVRHREWRRLRRMRKLGGEVRDRYLSACGEGGGGGSLLGYEAACQL